MNLILLLEDHDALRRSMAEALSGLPGAEVVAVATLRDGMEALARKQPDLVVSDLDLPDGSGIELLGYLGQPPAVPVLFVSGHVPQYQSKLHGIPGITVRHKPIALRELQDLAQEHLESILHEAPFTPSDYIQLACMGRHSVRIEVDGAKTRGVIVVNEGQLWSASCGAEQGIPALRRLSFDSDALTRCVTLRTVHAPRNLPERSWEQILLEVARAYDEAQRAPASKTSDASELLDEADFSDIFAEEPPPARASVPTAVKSAPDPGQDDVSLPRLTPPRIEPWRLWAANSQSAPIEPVPRFAPTIPARSKEDEDFALLLERAAEALLAKDYHRALHFYRHACSIRPNDSLVAANILRLSEIVNHHEQEQ